MGTVPVSMWLGTWSGISIAGGESLQLLKTIQNNNYISPLESKWSLIVCWNCALPRLNVGLMPESKDFCRKSSITKVWALSPRPVPAFCSWVRRQWLCNSLPVLHQLLKTPIIVRAVAFYCGSVGLGVTPSKELWGRKELIFILQWVSGWGRCWLARSEFRSANCPFPAWCSELSVQGRGQLSLHGSNWGRARAAPCWCWADLCKEYG